MHRAFFLIVVAGIVGLAAPAAAQQQKDKDPGLRRLTGPEVRQALAGNSTQLTIAAQRPTPLTITIFYDPTGALSFAGSDGTRDQGRWWVDVQGRYCSQWQKLRRAQQSCATVMRDRDVVHFIDADSRQGEANEYVARLVAGNAVKGTR